MSKHLVAGTAGHIDHGKTELVRALTGTDTDRLPEEKLRGITIDLGYAALDIGGVRLGIVDVPGHEAFVRNMLAGATGIDIALLVVAADEGVMPQTREHLAILDLLGITRGVVAVTKVDLTDDREWLDLVIDEVNGALAGTTLVGSPVVPVSARTGAGLDELRHEIAKAAGDALERPAGEPARLPIDRIFTVRGTGTVATGTLWSGRVRPEDTLRWMPHDRIVRVRAIQVHGRARTGASAGERVALAVPDLDRAVARRGDTLVGGAGWRATSMMTVRLRVLGGELAGVRHRQRVRVHLGTAETLARIVLLNGVAAVDAGEEAWAQLRLEQTMIARAGDRFVIRAYSPVRTIGGGSIVEPSPPKRRRAAADELSCFTALLGPDEASRLRAAATLAGEAGLDGEAVPIVARVADPAAAGAAGLVCLAGRYFAADRVEDVERAAAALLAKTHALRPLRPGATRDELRALAPRAAPPGMMNGVLDRLVARGEVVLDGPWARLAGFLPAPDREDAVMLGRLEAKLRSAGTAGIPPAEALQTVQGSRAPEELVDYTLRGGRAVRLSNGTLLAREAYDDACSSIAAALRAHGELGAGELKAVLGLSRKQLIPLLEHMDASGLTHRDGDVRRLATDSTRLETRPANS
jgi:selenocysteine-specific elongation factor